MKKLILLVLMSLSVAFFTSAVLAGPAPPLSDVNIQAFTAQNYGYQWKFTPPSYPKSMLNYSFSGPELYMSVIYMGYPNWNLTFVKVGGNQHTHNALFDSQHQITSGGIVIGYEIIYKIPAARLNSSNTISVSSVGTNGGSRDDVSTNIIFIK